MAITDVVTERHFAIICCNLRSNTTLLRYQLFKLWMTVVQRFHAISKLTLHELHIFIYVRISRTDWNLCKYRQGVGCLSIYSFHSQYVRPELQSSQLMSFTASAASPIQRFEVDKDIKYLFQEFQHLSQLEVDTPKCISNLDGSLNDFHRLRKKQERNSIFFGLEKCAISMVPVVRVPLSNIFEV